MSSVVKTGNAAHDAACLASLVTLQGALPAAVASGQAAVNAVYITHYKNCLASAKANNSGSGAEPFAVALRSLGAGGV